VTPFAVRIARRNDLWRGRAAVKSFFVMLRRDGLGLGEDDLERFRSTVEGAISYKGHVQSSRLHVNGTKTTALLALTNEPGAALFHEGEGVLAAVSGDCYDLDRLRSLRPSLQLARQISAVTGRFAAVVMDTRSGIVAVANTAARIDPLFVGERGGFYYVGTQASAVSCLVHGRIEYDVESLYTLVNAGFFGTDQTAFRAVSAVPPQTTLLFDGPATQRSSISLTELKTSPRAPEQAIEECTAAFQAAIAPVTTWPDPVSLGLSGGKDSRLVFSALCRLPVELRCYTVDRGADNAADVYLAGLLTKQAGLPHLIRREQRVIESATAESFVDVDLLQRTAVTLRATDGALSGHDFVRFIPRFSQPLTLVGLGGEVMRGGYAETRPADLDPGSLAGIATRQFGRYGRLFSAAAQERFSAAMSGWVAAHAAAMPPSDVLDCLYLYFRCGRWLASTSRGVTMSGPKLYPFLDNRLVMEMARAPASQKMNHRLIRAVLRRIDPAAAALPLAMEDWGDATEEERLRLRDEHPHAYSSVAGAPMLDWRNQGAPPVIDHIRRYCIEEGRIELLSAILNLAAVRAFLNSERAARQQNKNFLFGVYTACVLLSGDWLDDKRPRAPIRIAVERMRLPEQEPHSPVGSPSV
jgi:asparagine synthetase B (glutamine-hydrolysing)